MLWLSLCLPFPGVKIILPLNIYCANRVNKGEISVCNFFQGELWVCFCDYFYGGGVVGWVGILFGVCLFVVGVFVCSFCFCQRSLKTNL